MPAADADQAIHLDRHFDEILRGREPRHDPRDATVATLQQLHRLSTLPVPDPSFVHCLQTALIEDAVPPAPFMPGNWTDDDRHSANGHTSPWPASPAHSSPRLNRHWQQPLQLAAAVLVVVVLGAYLAVSQLGRGVPAPSRLSAVLPRSEGAVPRVLSIFDLGVESLIEPAGPLRASATPGENIWATGWRDGDAIPMTEPNDPLAVTWLEGSTALGEGGNIVLQGHNEYWDTGRAVFADLGDLSSMSLIQLTSVNDVTFFYIVEWVRHFPSHVGVYEQRGILGPTAEEALTLIAPAGTYDATTGTYPEVVVVRARHIWTDGLASMTIPDPTKCDVAPRSVAELDALAIRFTGKPAQLPIPTPPEVLTGIPADPLTAAAVVETTRELAACLNANDALRSFALYGDDGLLRLFDFMTSAFADPNLEWTPDFASLPELATPVPVNDQHVVWRVDDVRILDDGRVSAIVDISASQASQVPRMPTGEPALYIFAREGNRYLIDEVIFPLPPAPSS